MLEFAWIITPYSLEVFTKIAASSGLKRKIGAATAGVCSDPVSSRLQRGQEGTSVIKKSCIRISVPVLCLLGFFATGHAQDLLTQHVERAVAAGERGPSRLP